MSPRASGRIVIVLAVWSGTVSAQRAAAQPTPSPADTSVSPKPLSATQPAPDDQAAATFVDRNFGYSLIPPPGFVGSPTKVPGPGGSLRLVQFVGTKKDAWLRVRYSRARKEFTKDELLEGLRVELASVHRGATLRQARLGTVGGRPAAIGETEFQIDDRRFIRFQAAVQSQPDEVFLLIFQTAAEAFDDPRATFDRTLNSFRLPPLLVPRPTLEACFHRGSGWLASVASDDWADKLVDVAYWKLERDGKPLGFLRKHEEAARDNGTAGVRIRERAWFFSEDRSYRDVQNTIFLSFDLRAETWENLIQGRSDAGGSPTVLHDLHKSLRGDDKLLTMYTERPGDLALTHESLQVPRTYISMGLLRLFPRLVDLHKPQTYAFTAYDVESKQLMIRVLKVLGPMRDPRIRLTGPVFKIEDSVGVLGPAAEIFTDEAGRILKVRTGEVEMTASTWEKIQATFKEQMAWADDLYRRSVRRQEEAIQRLRDTAEFNTRPGN